jgi:hypothetical protein
MLGPRFGRTTQVKFIGGVLYARESGTPFVAMQQDLRAMRTRALDLRIPFQQFQRVWLAQTDRVFAAEGIPRWPRLSPAYADWKRRHYPGKTILRRTDRMYRSLTRAGNPDMIWQVTPRTIRYGTKVPYHRFTERTRPSLVMLPPTFAELNRLVMNHVMRGRRGQGVR